MGSRLLDALAWFAFFHVVVMAIPVFTETSRGFFEPGTATYSELYQLDRVAEAWLEIYIDVVGFGVMGAWPLLYSPVIWLVIKFFTGKWKLLPWKKSA